jgi:hypothetical protein
MSNVSAHTWSVSTIQAIISTTCLVFELSPSSLDKFDMSYFLVVAWYKHPDLIPNEVVCIFPEPTLPSVVGEPRLFLQASETIHSKCDTL